MSIPPEAASDNDATPNPLHLIEQFEILTLMERDAVLKARWREVDLVGATWTVPAK